MKKIYFILVTIFHSTFVYSQWTLKNSLYNAGVVTSKVANAMVINGDIYVFSDKSFLKYDAASDHWEYKKMPPGSGDDSTREGACVFAINGKGYAGFGLGSLNAFPYSYKESNDLWEYDPLGDTWTRKADLPSTGRYFAFSFVINNKAYIGGGRTYHPDIESNELWEYNPSSDSWLKKADLPSASNNGLMAFSGNNKGYIVGIRLNIDTLKRIHTFEYDPIADNWTMKTNYPGPTSYSGIAVSVGTSAFVGLGSLFPNPIDQKQTALYKYDMLNDTWSLFSNFAGANRSFAAAAIAHDSLYVGVGQYYPDWWKYEWPLGIQDKSAVGSVAVYPNPTSKGTTLILVLNSSENLNILVQDIMGSKVYESGIKSYSASKTLITLPMEASKAGVYLYTVVNDKGAIVAQGKIAKE